MMAAASYAQSSTVRLEFATRLDNGQAVLHVRVPRGQMVENPELVIDADETVPLTIEPIALAATNWLVLDASSNMVNFDVAVQAAIQRFLRNSAVPTGVILFAEETDVLMPTEDDELVAAFLSEYSAAQGPAACLNDALLNIAEAERPLDRSWRILLVTGGQANQDNCATQDAPLLSAPVDIITLTTERDETLENLVTRNGGEILSANLRTIETRFNEIRTRWGQPTYQLSTNDLDTMPIRATINLMLSNGQAVTQSVRFGTYNLLLSASPTPPATATATSAATAQSSVVTSAATVVAPTGPANVDPVSDDSTNILLIAGALFFVVGAVVLALALSRVNRQPVPSTGNTGTSSDHSSSFYAALEETPSPVRGDETVTKQRQADGNSVDVTQVAPNEIESATPILSVEQADDEAELVSDDELLITQVLTDDRFKKMISQSRQDQEIVGFVRVEGSATGDYHLTRRGLMIGRGMGCDIQITGDSAISRQHARMAVLDDGKVVVSRLSAVNPVVVDGSQVSNRFPLRPNDVIHLSDQTRLVYIANKPDLLEDTKIDLK